jgi:hypothetical protein
VRCRARRRRTIFGAALVFGGGDRRGVAIVTERPDEYVELGDLLFALTPGQLDLVGQLLELLERRPLIEWLDEWLGWR